MFTTACAAVGTPAPAITSLAKALEPSSRAAPRRGPEATHARAGQRVGEARDQRRLGADHHEVDRSVARRGHQAVDVLGADLEHARVAGDADVPRRAQDVRARGERARARTRACSRPPPPTTRTLTAESPT